MCGIVGLFLKNPALEPELGKHLAVMMIAMSDRGPDSAGIALYGHEDQGGGRLTLFHPDTAYDWAGFSTALGAAMGAKASLVTKGNHAIVTLQGETAPARAWIKAHRPELRVMGYGKAMDVFKDLGLPAQAQARSAGAIRTQVRAATPWVVRCCATAVVAASVSSISWAAQVAMTTTCSCLLYTSPSPRDRTRSRMPSSA